MVMPAAHPLLGLSGVAAAAALSLSGAIAGDPRTPAAAPGQPAPFLGTAVTGSGGMLAAFDAYGSLVDLRLPGPAGESQISNPIDRQRAGSVPPDTGVVIAASARGRPRPLWEGTSHRQAYRQGTGVLVSSAWLDGVHVRVTDAVDPDRPAFARRLALRAERLSARPRLRLDVNFDLGGHARGDRLVRVAGGFVQRDGARRLACRLEPRPASVRVLGGAADDKASFDWRGSGDRLAVDVSCSFGGDPPPAAGVVAAAARDDRRWLALARPLSVAAPAWAEAMYRRSLLVLRSVADRRTGALVAGARDFWAYVWPRDAAAAALALARSGYSAEAVRTVRFLGTLDLDAGARFDGSGGTVKDDRHPAGDAAGWVRVAQGVLRPGAWQRNQGLLRGSAQQGGRGFGGARAQQGGRGFGGASAQQGRRGSAFPGESWAGEQRDDYWEDGPGDYLGNALASGLPDSEILRRFGGPRGLSRRAADDRSGLDAAAAWAIVPFSRPALRAAALRTLRTLARAAGPYGITPGEGWRGRDPWTAETAWVAWGLAAAGEARDADRLLAALRRAATPSGALPERVDHERGIPRSTTPLAWSHAMAILALRSRYGPPR